MNMIHSSLMCDIASQVLETAAFACGFGCPRTELPDVAEAFAARVEFSGPVAGEILADDKSQRQNPGRGLRVLDGKSPPDRSHRTELVERRAALRVQNVVRFDSALVCQHELQDAKRRIPAAGPQDPGCVIHAVHPYLPALSLRLSPAPVNTRCVSFRNACRRGSALPGCGAAYPKTVKRFATLHSQLVAARTYGMISDLESPAC